MAKGKGGFIGQDGLNAPDAPTGVSGTAGDTQVTVSWTAPSDVGGSAITGYVATSNDGIGATGSSSPITVTGLTNGTSYTFNVWAINAFGYSAPSDASGSVSPVAPVGLIFGGFNDSGTRRNNVDKITLSTSGNASDFGDLQRAVSSMGAAASGTRALKFGGRHTSGGGSGKLTDEIDYFTIASSGNATDFGNLVSALEANCGLSNSTRAVNCIGSNESGTVNELNYVTIASTGNATDFGDAGQTAKDGGACASSTRGVIWLGDGASNDNTIEYITIASTGNTTDFGDASIASRDHCCCSSSDTRGLSFGGEGGGAENTIEYITIASTGNATDFGDPNSGRDFAASMANSANYAYLCGGRDVDNGSASFNEIEYVTISSTGNGTDFGDLTATVNQVSGCSNVHGGL